MDTQLYTITFELYDGQSLTREIHDGNVKISEIFLKLKINYDWVEELNLDSQWIVESRGTKKVFSQCEDSISTVLGDLHSDTFTFQKNGTIGLEIYKWQLDLQNYIKSQDSYDIESIMSYMQLGEQLFTEQDYYEALLSYFNVLTLDPKNQQALQGLGNCLAYLECEKCLAVYEMLLQQNPENNEYKFQKARGLNKLKRHQEAQIILNQLEKTNFGNKSYVQQEIVIYKQQLGIIDKPEQDQNVSNMIEQCNLQEDESLIEESNKYIQQIQAGEQNQENIDLDTQQTKCDDLSQEKEKQIDDSNNEQNNENNQLQKTDVENQNIAESVDDKKDSPSKHQDDQNNPEI